MKVLDRFPRILPVTGREDELQQRLQEDRHGLPEPTHVLVREGRIVGGLSIGRVPVVFVWVHSKEGTPFDSALAMAFAENVFAPGTLVCVPCSEGSPFFPVLKKSGDFTDAGSYHMFLKRV